MINCSWHPLGRHGPLAPVGTHCDARWHSLAPVGPRLADTAHWHPLAPIGARWHLLATHGTPSSKVNPSSTHILIIRCLIVVFVCVVIVVIWKCAAEWIFVGHCSLDYSGLQRTACMRGWVSDRELKGQQSIMKHFTCFDLKDARNQNGIKLLEGWWLCRNSFDLKVCCWMNMCRPL